MDKLTSIKNKYSPSADAALIEQVTASDQLPDSIQNVISLADKFCHNNNSQQEVQLCGLTLLRMLENTLKEFQNNVDDYQKEKLQRAVLIRFGDCQLSKSTRRICADIIRQLLFVASFGADWDLNFAGDDFSLPWPYLFDQLLQVADDESQDTNLRQMSLVVFAENMDVFYKFSRDIQFSDRHERFVEIVKRWLNGSNYEFAIAAARCAEESFCWSQHHLTHLWPPQAVIVNAAFGDIVPFLLLAYRNTCDVDEYDAEKQTQFVEHIQAVLHSGEAHPLLQDPKQYQQLCDVFIPICRKNVGKNREIVNVLCSIMISLTESNTTIHEFIATTPGEMTKFFNFFVDLMCSWLEVEYDAEKWPNSFAPLSEDEDDLEELWGFDRVPAFVYFLIRIFDGKEVSTLMAQMLERMLEGNNDNNSNHASSPASHKIPFNSAASTFQQNSRVLNSKYPQWMISASILWCLGWVDQALVNRLGKHIYSLFKNFILPAALNHEHPFVRYSALYSVWRLHWRNILRFDDSKEARSIRKRFLEILATKLHAAQDCYRVQEFAGLAIGDVFVESVDSDSDEDSAENNISNAKEISIPNRFVQSIFDSLSNHESKPNFVVSSHLRALADICEKTSSEHLLNLNDQCLPLLQHLVQKYHSILLQEIESSNNNNNYNYNNYNSINECDDDEEDSEFSRKARLNPSFKFDVACLTNSIRAATRVLKFIPASEEQQPAAKELSSFVVELLETLQLRAKDQILVDLLGALGFLCTRLGKNNFPNDRDGADLVDRMMPPLIHYAMLDHLIQKNGRIVAEVSDEIVKVKQTVVGIICEICKERGELIKRNWTSSIGDIIIHLLEIDDDARDKMHKIGYDLFIAVGNAIGHPTSMDETDELEELARKNFVGSNVTNNGSEETSKLEQEEWKFLTKVANRVVLRFLGLKKVLDFKNNLSPKLAIANRAGWTIDLGSKLHNRTPMVIACLLPHISPSIWYNFAEVTLSRIVRIFLDADPDANEFENEYKGVTEKATKLQARRQQHEQRAQQQLLLESGNRRQRRDDADDDDAETQPTLRENQLDEDVLVRQLEQAKQKYISGEVRVSFEEGCRAVRKCLKIALAGIPASRVVRLWSNSKLKDSLGDLIRNKLGQDLLGLPLHDWTKYFDGYYDFAKRFLAEDAERGRMKNNECNNNSSHPVSLPLKTRLELIVPMAPSLDLAFVLSQTSHVPRMMKSVLESDLFNTPFQLSPDSQTDTRGTNFFILSCVDTSLVNIIVLIQKFQFIPLPEHSGEDAVKFVFERNKELSLELDRLLVVVKHFADFFIRNFESLCKSSDSLLRLAKVLRERFDRNGQHKLFDGLETLATEKPKLFIKMYIVLHAVAILEVVEGLFNMFPQEFVEGQTTVSKETFEFAESFLHSNIAILVNFVLKPTQRFVADEGDNYEEATGDEHSMSLEFIDAKAQKLLRNLTKYEGLLKQYQKQQNVNNDVEQRDNSTDEKSKNSDPSKLWTTKMIEEIKHIMSGMKEEQPTTED